MRNYRYLVFVILVFSIFIVSCIRENEDVDAHIPTVDTINFSESPMRISYKRPEGWPAPIVDSDYEQWKYSGRIFDFGVGGTEATIYAAEHMLVYDAEKSVSDTRNHLAQTLEDSNRVYLDSVKIFTTYVCDQEVTVFERHQKKGSIYSIEGESYIITILFAQENIEYRLGLLIDLGNTESPQELQEDFYDLVHSIECPPLDE